MAREIRLDRGRLSKTKRTSQGFARVDARLTRTGILEYARPDGSVQREYRPEDEVFRADSLESLDGVPVTDLHPPCMVDATNRSQYSIGTVRAPRRDGIYPVGQLQIEDAGAIAKVDAGERVEISCGYSCDLDPTPGVFEGQRYDAVQRNIQYNHVAIGPSNWGRAGAEVRMRLDSADARDATQAGALVSRFDDSTSVGENGLTRDNPAQRICMKIGKFEIKVDANDEQIVADALKSATERADAAEAKAAELSAQAGAQAVELAAAKSRADAAEARVAKIDRAELEQTARVALGAEFKFDGKTDGEVRAAVVTKMLPGVRVDVADASFVSGAYSAAIALANKAQTELAQSGAESGARADSTDDKNDPAKARAEMIAARRDAALVK